MTSGNRSAAFTMNTENCLTTHTADVTVLKELVNTTSAKDHSLPHPDAIPVGHVRKFFWLCGKPPFPNQQTAHYFSTDEMFKYEPFWADFGPLNLGQIYRYCEYVNSKLNDEKLAYKVFVHYCDDSYDNQANSILLACAYHVIVHGVNPESIMKDFERIIPLLKPYRDATCGPCSYNLTILDCLRALEYASSLGWYDLQSFDINEYERLENIASGDINWIIPRKIAAFSEPTWRIDCRPDSMCFAVDDCVKALRRLNIGTVIRLNKGKYDASKFLNGGIDHYELYFQDGSCPSRDIVSKFIDLCEKAQAPVGVHCKAGLGRTGTLIGCYALKNYRFPAHLWIGWNRLCRPGSILGPQQRFLLQIQDEMMRLPRHGSVLGNANRTRTTSTAKQKEEREGQVQSVLILRDQNERKTAEAVDNMTSTERKIAKYGEQGQGERLRNAKFTSLAIKSPLSISNHTEAPANAHVTTEEEATPVAARKSTKATTPTKNKPPSSAGRRIDKAFRKLLAESVGKDS